MNKFKYFPKTQDEKNILRFVQIISNNTLYEEIELLIFNIYQEIYKHYPKTQDEHNIIQFINIISNNTLYEEIELLIYNYHMEMHDLILDHINIYFKS